MTEWYPNPQTGLRVGLALIAAIALVDAGLVIWAATQPVSGLTFLIGLFVLGSLAAIGAIGYRISGLVQSAYVLDRNALVILWGESEHVVPLPHIQQVLLGEEVKGRLRFQGIRWPGYWVGYGEIEGLGPALFHSTAPLEEQVLLVTPGLTYAISPEDRNGFLTTLQTRMQMGPTQVLKQVSYGPAFAYWDFWKDRPALILLAGGLGLLLVLTGFLCFRFPHLPPLLPLHFDALGIPDRLGVRGQIFFIPLIGLIVLTVNGVLGGLLYQKERLAAYLLWGSALMIQILFWIAVLGILAVAD
ncbi:MAG: PH domain-containing protein [Anaerolineae bacterium]|nr:PH domain-containing protein [Anaerolineae bacterium]MDW8069509.1 PH domain-containing protein [Anaerolineae bacterium]